MAAPKFNDDKPPQQPTEQPPAKATKHKTILKSVTLDQTLNGSCTKIDTIIAKMEGEGYSYHEHINVSFNEKILVFKLDT